MKFSVTHFMLVLLCAQLSFAGEEARFLRYPDIYKDKIVFEYQRDLWLVSSSGGVARRITSAPGNEFSPKFSPDGKWIAFSGDYDGAINVYVIPAEGGAPTRVTYQPGFAQVVCWTPDGKRIVYRSYSENFIGRDPNLYFVDKNGSAPERFPIDRGRLCSFSPDGKQMVYQRRGSEDNYWKRYKGGQHTDLWKYDFTTAAFTPLSSYVGKNAYPMWIGDAMYFVCDSTNGISNIYREDLLTKKIDVVTSYTDVDVMMPSTDGSTIVFTHDGYLHLLNVATGEVKQISVECPSDDWTTRTKVINPKDFIHSARAGNDGKDVAIEARGDVFIVPADKGEAKNVSNSPGTRESYPELSPDGKTVAFFSDKSGEYELYTQSATGGPWTQLTTTLDRTVYHLEWAPDGKKILFGNKDFAIFVLDVASKKLTKIDESNQLKNDEFYWEVSDYGWSPDSKWVCYSLVQYNRNSQIFIYNIEENKKYAVTDDFFDNLNPTFDRNGDYLYYLSSRNFDILMDFYEDDHVVRSPQTVMAVQLRDGEKPPFLDSDDNDVKKKAPEEMRIDVAGLQKRTYPLPVPAGNYFYLKAGKGKVAWCAVDNFTEDEYEEIFKPKGETKWKLTMFDMGSKKDAELADKISDYDVSPNGEQLTIRKDKEIFVTTFDKAFASKNAGEKVSLSTMLYTVDYRQEWNQIFNDCWRWYRDFFYDPNMHGRDWKAIGEKYRSYIQGINSREELNWIMQQMVGELCVSHTYIGGGDNNEPEPISSPLYTGELGADIVADKETGLYKFQKIYVPTEYNENAVAPLARPDYNIKEGDYLLAINGTELKAPDDYNKYLQVTSGEKVSITVNAKPTLQGAKVYEVEPIHNDISLRYFRWLADNIKKVSDETNGKVGYMHINAMGAGGIGEFDKFWRAFRYKDALIIDVRRNSGGWTEYFLIDKLERQVTAQSALHGMIPLRYPGSTSIGNYVVVSNEDNGSDGEAFIESFKARKLGTVVGVTSWGGLVGIQNTQRTIDNGTVEQSNTGFYGEGGTWLVENHGADPDITVENDPASVMAGKDPQLEEAIQVALKKAKEHPYTFPPVPPFPKP
ncbi:MAG TPA: S41 family peptidase [Bacteroidota bacterium]|nr:S41 family peptidase [Bacteroidota bacterium]